MTAFVLALPAIVLPLLAWLLWDIGRQQARREAARQAAIKAARDRYVIRFVVDTYPFAQAMKRVAKAINEINWDAARRLEEAARKQEDAR